jgi:hypothetical protein
MIILYTLKIYTSLPIKLDALPSSLGALPNVMGSSLTIPYYILFF